jgi:hypothetical protein
MLKWIRGTRLSMKTTVIVIAVALVLWALVIWVRIETFVPPELLD